MRRTPKSPYLVLLSILVSGVLLAGCSSSADDNDQASNDDASGNNSVDIRDCETTDLTASVAKASDIDNGRTVTVRLLNGSQSECSIAGAPGVDVTSDQLGSIVRSEVVMSDEGVSVKPGESGQFDVSYANGGTQSCTKGDRLDITPPTQQATLLLPLTRNEIPSICSDSALTISPVTGSGKK